MVTSIRVKFRPSTVAGREGGLYFQVIHRRVIRQINTRYRLYEREWEDRTQSVKIAGVNDARSAVLLSVKDSLRWDIVRLQRIIRNFNGQAQSYTADDVVLEFQRISAECTLRNYMQAVITRLLASGHSGTGGKYQSSLNSFMRFRHDEDITLDAIDSDLMQTYEAWLWQQGLTRNGSSSCLRNLRAVYNRAVEAGLVEQSQPFRHVYTGTDRTIKRAVSFEVIRKIKNADLSRRPALALARDLFLFSFYTRGMSFVDMAYLQPEDIKGGYLVYQRQKTKQTLNVKWEACMQEIVGRYSQGGSAYLLPIITQAGNERLQYQSFQRLVNHNLHTLSLLLGLERPLTMYVARHSWASIAHGKGVPLQVISGALGHDNEQTTQIYLSSIDTSAIDAANRRLLDEL